MYVVDFGEKIRPHIVANMDVTVEEIQGRKRIHAIPYVAAFKLQILQTPANENQDNFPNYFLLRSLIQQHNDSNGMNQNELLNAMHNLMWTKKLK